jgi:hypothetical protein
MTAKVAYQQCGCNFWANGLRWHLRLYSARFWHLLVDFGCGDLDVKLASIFVLQVEAKIVLLFPILV